MTNGKNKLVTFVTTAKKTKTNMNSCMLRGTNCSSMLNHHFIFVWKTRRWQVSWDAAVKPGLLHWVMAMLARHSMTVCFCKSWFVSLHLWRLSSPSPLSSSQTQGQGRGGRSIHKPSEVTVTKGAKPLWETGRLPAGIDLLPHSKEQATF